MSILTIRSRSWVVAGALLTLGLVAALWAAASPAYAGGGCRGMPATLGETTAVETGDSPCFEPTLITVDEGETVTWTNKGSLPHMVTGANASWGDYTEFRQGESVSHQFTSAGAYPYYCLLHPGMVGAVLVMSDVGSNRAESASLAGSSDLDRLSNTAVSENCNSSRGPLILAGAVAALLVFGSFGFVLGQRRRSG